MVSFKKNSRATLHTSMGDIEVEFLNDKAPRTVENFVRLAHKGFYDGLTFHRILKGFMIQGGCPKGDGTGGPGHTIGPEFNDTPHVPGVVSMARSNDPHSAGSQFFMMLGEGRYLDSKYAAFARVVTGDEVLEKIAAVPVQENRWREQSKPLDPIYINRIELSGVDFDEDELAEMLGKPSAGNQAAGSESGGKDTAGDDAAASADESGEPEPSKDSKDGARSTRKRSGAKRSRNKRPATAKDGE